MGDPRAHRRAGAARRLDRLSRRGGLHREHHGRRRHRGMTGAEEQRGLALLQDASDAIVAGVERELPGWVERSVRRILDAWGRTPADARARAERDAVDAGRAATDRIVNELRALFARDVEEQRST